MKIEGANVNLLAFLVCDSLVTDAKSGKKSIQGIFDTIFTEGVPVRYGNFTIFFRLRTDDPDVQVEMSPSLALVHPSGITNEFPAFPMIELTTAKTRDAVVNIQGMVFPELGLYKIELRLNGILAAVYPVMLQKVGVATHGKQLH